MYELNEAELKEAEKIRSQKLQELSDKWRIAMIDWHYDQIIDVLGSNIPKKDFIDIMAKPDQAKKIHKIYEKHLSEE